MSYPLNQEAMDLLSEYRIDAFKQGFRTNNGKKYKRWNADCVKVAKSRFTKVPEHVQMKMALKAKRLGWESVWVPKNTWDFDAEGSPKRTNEQIAAKPLEMIEGAIKEIPKHDRKREVSANNKLAREALDKLKDITSLKEGCMPQDEARKLIGY